MGFNDQPQWIKAKFTCDFSRSLGKQEIMRMLNNSFRRTYSYNQVGPMSINFPPDDELSVPDDIDTAAVVANLNTTSEYSVDDYFNIKPRTADYELGTSAVVINSLNENEEQNQIKISRLKYGKNDFSITSPYIQTESAAKDLMGWIVKKTMRPKKSVGVNIFATPILQLGDIVTIKYKNNAGIDMIAPENVRFVVYNIEYSRSNAGPNMLVYLSEV
jgi:hypothetical protein